MTQLIVVLDTSIVNIALPSIQKDLGLDPSGLTWVVTAYSLAAGGLLLLGGRIADYAGRKRMLIVGLIGFAAASALGGAAINGTMLISARALQGVFAAVLAPAALSLVTVTFTDSKERAKAFGVYGALSGGGAAIGIVLGGLLTEYASWHWVMFVNVPIAALAVVLAFVFVRESRATGDTKYDVPGAVTATLGLVSLVYGISKATTEGWGGTQTLTFIGIAIVLLAAFLIIESRSTHPLLPLKVLANRNRGGAYLASFFVGIGMFGMFLFLTYFMQGVLGYKPLQAGVLFLPFSAGVILSAGLASQLLPRIGPRLTTGIGFVLAAIGMVLFMQISPHTTYASGILPGMIVMSIGMGLIFVPLSAVSLFAVGNHDAGVASAVLNTSQQIGGAIGIAFLNTIAASATAAFIVSNAISPTDPAGMAEAAVAGYTRGFTWSTCILVFAGLIWIFMVNMSKKDLKANDAPMAHVG